MTLRSPRHLRWLASLVWSVGIAASGCHTHTPHQKLCKRPEAVRSQKRASEELRSLEVKYDASLISFVQTGNGSFVPGNGLDGATEMMALPVIGLAGCP